MRRIAILVSSIFVFTACSTLENDQEIKTENNETSIEENKKDNQKEKLTPEEKLIKKLPENISVEDWNLILVNPWEPLPKDYEVELVEVDNEQQIDARIVENWKEWKEDALEEGHRLFFASGYRSIELQRNNYNNTIQKNMDEGMTEEEAEDKAKEYLTEPGHSEHHTGLALDIVDEEWIVAGKGLIPEYDQQESQQWLIDTMADYGFVLRYPENKEDITGILYESWHFRYVGTENAKFMLDHNLTLEEYIDLIKKRDESNH